MGDRPSQVQQVGELRSVHLFEEVVVLRIHQGVVARPQGKEVARLEGEGSKAYHQEAWTAFEEPGEVLLVAELVAPVRLGQVLSKQLGAR